MTKQTGFDEKGWYPKSPRNVSKVNVANVAYGPAALTDKRIVAYTSLSASRLVVLPAEDCADGTTTEPRIITVIDESGDCAAGVTLTVSITGGTIDGAANIVLNTAYAAVTLMMFGTTAFIVNIKNV